MGPSGARLTRQNILLYTITQCRHYEATMNNNVFIEYIGIYWIPNLTQLHSRKHLTRYRVKENYFF